MLDPEKSDRITWNTQIIPNILITPSIPIFTMTTTSTSNSILLYSLHITLYDITLYSLPSTLWLFTPFFDTSAFQNSSKLNFLVTPLAVSN